MLALGRGRWAVSQKHTLIHVIKLCSFNFIGPFENLGYLLLWGFSDIVQNNSWYAENEGKTRFTFVIFLVIKIMCNLNGPFILMQTPLFLILMKVPDWLICYCLSSNQLILRYMYFNMKTLTFTCQLEIVYYIDLLSVQDLFVGNQFIINTNGSKYPKIPVA